MAQKINLTTIENLTVEFCKAVQKYCKQIDLSYVDIPATSKILVQLYRVQRDLDKLRELNNTHEVIDNRTGKVLGELYDNDYIGGVMLTTNIEVGFQIRACEGEIGRLTKKQLI